MRWERCLLPDRRAWRICQLPAEFFFCESHPCPAAARVACRAIKWPTSPRSGISLGSRESRTRGRGTPASKPSRPSPSGATTGSAGAAPRIASRSRPLRPRSRRNRPAFLPEGSHSSGWDFSMTSPGTPRTSWRRRYGDAEATRVSRLRGRSLLALDPDRPGCAARSAPDVSCLPANETRLLPGPSLVVPSKRRTSRSRRKRRFQTRVRFGGDSRPSRPPIARCLPEALSPSPR